MAAAPASFVDLLFDEIFKVDKATPCLRCWSFTRTGFNEQIATAPTDEILDRRGS